MSAQDNLIKQILGQGTSSKWTGGFGAKDAAADMAKILSGIGITDINQFGKVDTYTNVEPVGELYQNQLVRTAYNDDNQPAYKYIMQTVGFNYDASPISEQVQIPSDAKLDTAYGFRSSDPYELPSVLGGSKDVIFKDGQPVFKSEVGYGNKETGQLVPRTYSERQTGNAWGGTFAGSGNTGYRVQFGPDGTPYFYTTGASSSDIGDLAPLLAVASFIPGVAPFAQGLNAVIAAKSGNPLGAIAGLAGLGDFAGISGAADVANAARMGSALQSGDPLAILMSGANVGGVTDVGGVNLGDVSKGIGAVKAIQSGDPLAMLRYGMGAMSKGDGLTSNLGPGDMGEFSDSLIPGYFQPGGEGYIPPSGGDTYTGSFDDYLGEPTNSYTGSFDDYLGTPTDTEEPTDGSPKTGGAGGPRGAPKTSGVGGKLGNAIAGVAGALGAGAAGAAMPGTNSAAQQQTSNADLLNFLSSQDKGANIKSFKELFGEGLFGDSYVPPSAGGAQAGEERQAESSPASQGEGDEQFYGGGHVDDFDADALLQILRD